MHIKKLSLLAMIFMFTACARYQEPVVQPTMTPLPLDTPTATLVPTQIPTDTPTLTPEPTLTETPPPTLTVTLTPTLALTARLIWPRAFFTSSDVSWAPAGSWCPLRGENLTCETEYRKDKKGCYVGHTCYDACGWFYSVDTIPPGVRTFSDPCW